MRRLAWPLAIVLVAAPLAGGRPADASTAELISQAESLVRGFPGGSGVWIADPNQAAPLYTWNADERVVTASLYKLAVMAEAEKRVDAREMTYATVITIEQEDITADGSFEPAGTEMSLDAALEAMITISDNGSALALWRILGPSAINATLAAAGLRDFHIALDPSEDNVATPRAVGTFMTLLAKRQLISAAASDRMLARLGRQQINDRLPALLPQGVTVAHKTGNLPGLTHDAGIVYTPSGPRVVVAMTWDAFELDADQFIASLGSAVYAAVLEPPANASYGFPRGLLYAEVRTTYALPLRVANRGTADWPATGERAIGLIWELRDAKNTLVGAAPAPLPLGALRRGATTLLTLRIPLPPVPGDHRLTVGLTDARGAALASLGAAVASTAIRVHDPFVANLDVRMPRALHRGEASLLIVDWGRRPATGADIRVLTLAWRAIDPATKRAVASGTTLLGTVRPGEEGGTLYAPFVAPQLRGTYFLEYELREAGRIVGETFTTAVEIFGPRTYPDDRPAVARPPAPRATAVPRPSGTPQPSARGRTATPRPVSP